jgi:mono/diheme cytochrome c family protein
MIVAAAAVLLAQVPTPSPVPISPKIDAGVVYGRRCAFCHGEDGRGQTKKGLELKATNFTNVEWQKHNSDNEIVKAVTDGIPEHKMPSFKDRLSPEEIHALVPYLREFANQR